MFWNNTSHNCLLTTIHRKKDHWTFSSLTNSLQIFSKLWESISITITSNFTVPFRWQTPILMAMPPHRMCIKYSKLCLRMGKLQQNLNSNPKQFPKQLRKHNITLKCTLKCKGNIWTQPCTASTWGCRAKDKWDRWMVKFGAITIIWGWIRMGIDNDVNTFW